VFNEYDVVRLRKPLPSESLPVGTRGTILVVPVDPALPRAYIVEFLNDEGDTLAVAEVEEDFLEKA